MRTLTRAHARHITLECQGLSRADAFGRGKAGALSAIEHLGYVQIDTIAVVERAHHHVFWSRVSDYRPSMLDELLEKDRHVFEYWSHALSYLPMKDFRFSTPRMRETRKKELYWGEKKLPGEMRKVLNRIRREGPLRILDFEESSRDKIHLWASKKPAKIWLEALLYEGRLMISGRSGFQKKYDLTERVLPKSIDSSLPSRKERVAHLVERVVRAHGFAALGEIHYLNNQYKADVIAHLKKQTKAGKLVELNVEGVDKTVYYADPETLERALATPRDEKKILHILSPFDNLVIQRKRLKALFDYDYLIECYVPAPKRKFGYFCLPLLWGDQFVGRIDAKADRASKTLLVQKLWLEPGVRRNRELDQAMKEAFQKFAQFNGCEKFREL